MGQCYRQLLRYIEQMDTQHWLLLLVGVVIVGFFCMQGFGSRSDY